MARFLFPQGLLQPTSLALCSAGIVVISMPWSPFLLSLGMWGMVFSALWHRYCEARALDPFSRWPILWKGALGRAFTAWFEQKPLWLISLLWLIPFISGAWSADEAFWLERVRVRLPFVVLPWVFANLPPLSRHEQGKILSLLVYCMVLLGIGVAAHYALHKEAILYGIEHGKPIPVPRHHIRFSLMVATAILVGGWLWKENFRWRYAWERTLLSMAVIFLIGFIHFLSVRSGLAALYAGMLFLLAFWTWRTRRWKAALIALIGAALVATFTFWAFPSMQEKWEYTLYDWKQYSKHEGANYSDSERWISLHAGWILWRRHPWVGVGAGDLPEQIKQVVAEYFPEHIHTFKLPHNQFLYLLASTGLVGLLCSLIAWSGLLWSASKQEWLFWAFQTMFFVSCLVEYTIETSTGVAWSLFYSLWFWSLDRTTK